MLKQGVLESFTWTKPTEKKKKKTGNVKFAIRARPVLGMGTAAAPICSSEQRIN